MADAFSGPDPFLRETPLQLQCIYYPLGFPLHLQTNCPDVLMAAREIWGDRLQAFDKPPLRLRVIVSPGEGHAAEPVYRGQEHLMSIIADDENFAVCDHTRNFAFCRLSAGTARDRPFAGYFFLEAIGNYSLTQLYLTPIHAACVSRDGRGVLLCGPSGAGKTSLAYFLARNGWTYVSDNESWLVRAEERLLLGAPERIRFRDSGMALFPELKGRVAALHANGKMSIVVTPASIGGIATADRCCVEYVVFLAREAHGGAMVRPVPVGQALEQFLSDLPLYEKPIRAEQQASLKRIAALNPVELRYSSLDDARERLESLVP
jgi:hypothetical protein